MPDNITILKSEISVLQDKYDQIERKNQDLNQRLHAVQALYEISNILSSSLDLHQVMQSIQEIFVSNFELSEFSLMLFDTGFEKLTIQTAYGLNSSALHQQNYLEHRDIFQETINRTRHIYVPEMTLCREYDFHPGSSRVSGSFLSVPLCPDNRPPVGLLNMQYEQPEAFSAADISLIQQMAIQIARTIDNILLFRHTKELSLKDELTNIYNRRYFNQRFEREVKHAGEYNRPLTIAMIDIDFFKNYNDRLGHLMGDEVLKKVAAILSQNIQKTDILARFGGEEFVLILPEINKTAGIQVAKKLRRAIERHQFPGANLQPEGRLTVSVGLASLPNDETDANRLLELADRSLYAAKEGSRNVVGYCLEPDVTTVPAGTPFTTDFPHSTILNPNQQLEFALAQ